MSMDLFAARRHAAFSPCRNYRYRLKSVLNESLPRILWIMLNPSTADEHVDDPTVRRVWQWSARWGYGVAEICNLFAWRSTDPAELRRAADPVGPENDIHVAHAAERAHLVICAWGVHGSYLDRSTDMRRLLAGRRLYCLALTKDGEPGHPLYLRGDVLPVLMPSHWPAS